MKFKLLITFAAISFILLTGCGEQPAAVDTYSLMKQSLSRTSEQQGQIVSEQGNVFVRTALFEQPVVSVHCETGQRVNKGDVLFQLDGSDLQAEIDSLSKNAASAKQRSELQYQYAANALEQAKASRDIQMQALYSIEQELGNAVAQLRQMQQETASSCDQAQQTVNQLAEALRTMQPDTEEYAETSAAYQEAANQLGALSDAADELAVQISQTEAELHSAEQETEATARELDREIADQEYELKSMRSEAEDSDSKEIEKLKQQYAALTVTAPCSGIVSECFGAAGQICEDGVLAVILPDDTFSVQLSVPDQIILAVKSGQKATFHTDASAEEYACTVTDVSAVRSEDGFSVRLQPAQQEGLLIGMQAYISLVLEEKETYAVPNAAVCYNDDGTICVFTVESDGEGTEIAVRHEVKTGIVDGEYTEIITDELQDGAQIILEPSAVFDGSAVSRNVTG